MTASIDLKEATPLTRVGAGWACRLSRALGRGLSAVGRRLEAAGAPQAAAAAAAEAASSGGDRFKSLASMIPGVVYQRIVRPDGDIRYTYISEGAREIFGVNPEDVLKNPEALFSTFSDDYKANFRKRLLAASQSLTKWDVEASIVAPDGSIKYTHAIAKPERLADGSVLWTGLILDATRIKQVEQELLAANRSVEAANQAKSMFLANMSHEIRTPMNGVLGMAEVLLKTELNQRQRRLLSSLRSSARMLLGIINDVLDISRIEAGRFEIECEAFDLRQCLEDAVEVCASAAYQKGLELNLIIASELPRIVRGDAGRLRQILINLIGNAVKFTAVGEATLRVSSASRADGRACLTLEVIDTGIGIDAEAKAKLFAPFSQADASINRRFGGTGLGLAITRHLVTLMGGDIELESEIGKGTRFIISLPLEVPAESGTTSQILPAIAGQRILIVDDRSTVRQALVSHFIGTGANVELATGATEALAMLRGAESTGERYCAVIIDRIRPGSDSMDLCQDIKADPALAANIVVAVVPIAWKGLTEVEHAERIDAVLTKPVRHRELLHALVGLLGARASAQAAEPEQGAGPARKDAGPKPGLEVLLVEDNPVNQEVAREFLSELGCSIAIANDGREAVDAFTRGRFDIVLMDCQMPGLDGLSATRLIRESERLGGASPTPIIAVTANAYESDRLEALAAGMNDCLTKPFSGTSLAQMLAKWTTARADRAAA